MASSYFELSLRSEILVELNWILDVVARIGTCAFEVPLGKHVVLQLHNLLTSRGVLPALEVGEVA